MSRLVWDTESKETKLESESWNEYRQRCGIGVAVVYDEDRDDWEVYGERDLDALAERLEGSSELVSYNGVRHDHVVLDAALARRVYIPSELDLWQLIQAGRDGEVDPAGSWKLGETARRTLGQGKLGSGASAPAKLREGRWAEVVSYCIRDVKLTRDLWRFVRQFGYVIGPDEKRLVLGVKIDELGV